MKKKKFSFGEELLKHSTLKSLLLVIVAALTLEATSLIQIYFSHRELEHEASKRAETQLEATKNRIMGVIDEAEVSVNNNVWITQWCIKTAPDSLKRVISRIVKDNSTIVGSCVALIPGYDPKRPLYAPYVYDTGDGPTLRSLATEEYDYPSKEWFKKPLELDFDYWSEPYVDVGGGEILMTTYSLPVKDYDGNVAAVLTGDLSLDWLTETIEAIEIYPHATSIVLSRTGRFLVCSDKEFVMEQTVQEAIDQMRGDEDFQDLNDAMLKGYSGNTMLKYGKERYYVYYAPVEVTGWSMCIVIPENDIYGSIRETEMLVKLLQVIGIIMLILILRSLVKSMMKNKELDEKKERMEGELRIARNIQMSMIPKTFPPFPDRHDLDIYADIVPAKEVGGDLYDFYIRDEKFIFCVGDVSGKGVPASLVMAVTRSMFRTISAREDSPGKIVSSMNKSLSDMNDSSMFVTFFCGVLDLCSGHLHYCNAGHNPPIMLTDEMSMMPVDANLPLGIDKDMKFQEQDMVLSYDDALFLYTDGLTEAENIRHEQFGEERVKVALHGRKSSEKHLETVMGKVNEFVGDAPQSDDLTMFFIHYLGGGESTRIVLKNDVSEISRLEGFVDSVASGTGIDQSLAMSLNLALEEAVANVVSYAWPKGTEGKITVVAERCDHFLRFTISDDGKPFDPTTAPPPDISSSAEKRPVGGLGIFMVRNIMDDVSYEWRDGLNILKLTKNLK